MGCSVANHASGYPTSKDSESPKQLSLNLPSYYGGIQHGDAIVLYMSRVIGHLTVSFLLHLMTHFLQFHVNMMTTILCILPVVVSIAMAAVLW